MKINDTKINFKGYDALPLKSIKLSKLFDGSIEHEMQEIGLRENILIDTFEYGSQWLQDIDTFIEKSNELQVISHFWMAREHIKELNKTGSKVESSPYCIKGGNVFIGKYPNGEKWMLTGESEIFNKNLKEISETYEIKEENIHLIPLMNFHLDLFIRPIGYPYVLVNDDKMVNKETAKMEGKNKDLKKFRSDVINHQKNIQKKYPTTTDEVCKSLEELGFVPIRVPAVWGESVNFINAIVNQHKDGTISYITGSSKCENKYISSCEKIFEKILREKVPNLKNIYFVEGEKDDNNKGYGNKIMQSLKKFQGGLHCLTSEVPDFEIWG